MHRGRVVFCAAMDYGKLLYYSCFPINFIGVV